MYSTTRPTELLSRKAPGSAVRMAARTAPSGRHQLLVVWRWEVRRLQARRSTLVAAGLLFLVFAYIVLVSQSIHPYVQYGFDRTLFADNAAVLVTTVFGAGYSIPASLGFVLGALLPFLAAEPAVRDWRRRTQELVLTTPVPAWAYVWGRYLGGLVACLALAVILLAAYLLTGLALHLAAPEMPPPNVTATLAVWTLTILPTVLLLGGISYTFALCFRRSEVVAGLLVVGWVACRILGHNFLWPAWDPTSGELPPVLTRQYQQEYLTAVAGITDPIRRAEIGRAVQQRWPDLSGFVGTHLAFAIAGIVAVALVGLVFTRHREWWI